MVHKVIFPWTSDKRWNTAWMLFWKFVAEDFFPCSHQFIIIDLGVNKSTKCYTFFRAILTLLTSLKQQKLQFAIYCIVILYCIVMFVINYNSEIQNHFNSEIILALISFGIKLQFLPRNPTFDPYLLKCLRWRHLPVWCVFVRVCQERKEERERERKKKKEKEKRERERLSSSRRACGFERMGGPSCELERSASLTESICMWQRNDTKGRKWGGVGELGENRWEF